MAGVFILYEHRLFSDIMSNILGEDNVVGAVGRPETPLSAVVEEIGRTRPSIVIVEADANGSSAWHITLASGEPRRVVVLDVERGVIRDYAVRTTTVDSVDELLLFLRRR